MAPLDSALLAQDTQTRCQATAMKDHCVCVCECARLCVHMCAQVYVCAMSAARMFVCVPVRVLIIKNKHVSLPVAEALVRAKQSAAC